MSQGSETEAKRTFWKKLIAEKLQAQTKKHEIQQALKHSEG